MEWFWILTIIVAVVGLAVGLGVGLGVKKNGNGGGGGGKVSFEPFPDYDSPCFKESEDVGIPIENQEAVSGHPASIQIVNASTEDMWIQWTGSGTLSGDMPTMWKDELDKVGIKNYMWQNDPTHPMGVFKLEAGSYVVLAYIGISMRIAALLGCKDAEFTGQGSLGTNCQVGVYPQTLVEWTYSEDPEDRENYDVIDSSFVDGFSLPVRIEYLTKGGSYTTILGKLTEQGCEEGGGYDVEYDGQYAGCKSPCAATGEDDVCCQGIYDTPEKCHPGGIPVAADVLDPWCDSITNMFSLDGKRLGYCFSYDDERGSILDHEKTNSRIKVVFCTDGFS